MSDIRPGLDIQEVTIGADDIDVLGTYGASAKSIYVASGTGTLLILTPNSTSYQTITVAAGYSLEMPITKVGGSTSGSTSGLKVQLIFR